MSNKQREELLEDYQALKEKYRGVMPGCEFGFGLIKLSVKMLMDLSASHLVSLHTIRIATEEGIKWHVEERAQQQKEKSK